MTLRDRTILLTLAGSRAHGTAGPDADVDLLGVYLPTRRALHGLFADEGSPSGEAPMARFRDDLTPDERAAADATKLEGTVHEVRKLLAMAMGGNPHVLEVLGTRDAEVRRCHALGERLRAHVGLFLTARCRDAFGGYARQQLARIRRHHGWWHDPPAAPRRADFGLPEQPALSRAQLDAAADLDAGAWVQDRLTRERAWRDAHDDWTRYRRWRDRRAPSREEALGYDPRHAAHLVRLLRMGHEVLTTGALHVWRGDRDADELRAIKAGAWTFDAVVAWADAARTRLEDATPVVPSEPDPEAVEALAIEVVEAGLDLDR